MDFHNFRSDVGKISEAQIRFADTGKTLSQTIDGQIAQGETLFSDAEARLTEAGEKNARALSGQSERIRADIEGNLDAMTGLIGDRGGKLVTALSERGDALGSLIDARIGQMGETIDIRLGGFETRIRESAEDVAIRLASSADTIETAVGLRLSGFEDRVTDRIGEVTETFGERADALADGYELILNARGIFTGRESACL